MNKTIEELRKSGYKVRVIHGKVDETDPHYHLSCNKTRIEITTPDGKELIGEARCSKGDQYNRKIGNRIALGRAFKTIKG
jgi:hypothetical protein